jgi:hypothetical protein
MDFSFVFLRLKTLKDASFLRWRRAIVLHRPFRFAKIIITKGRELPGSQRPSLAHNHFKTIKKKLNPINRQSVGFIK